MSLILKATSLVCIGDQENKFWQYSENKVKSNIIKCTVRVVNNAKCTVCFILKLNVMHYNVLNE